MTESTPEAEALPVVAEEIRVSKRSVETERVQLRTVVRERPVSITTELTEQSFEVERIPVLRQVDEPPAPFEDGDVTVFSVVEERPVVEKRLFVVEEVRIRRATTSRTVEIPATVRSTDVVVEHLSPDHTERSEPMTRTITALFDDRSEAEAAVERLKAAGLGAEDVRIHDKSSEGYQPDRPSTHQDRGLWASIKHAFLPDEDRHTYEEGVRRGGFLVTADVDENRAATAIQVLEESDTVDIDERSKQWRAEGWKPGPTSSAAQTPGQTGAVAEETLPVVEEQLVVGKREVDRGGVRVRSYVTEHPVHEQIRLRNERVQVERRPIDKPLSDAGDAFRERSIEVTAKGEEAVVGKTARVVEEVRVFKTAEESVQDINDTVRRTDVEIENEGQAEPTRPGPAR